MFGFPATISNGGWMGPEQVGGGKLFLPGIWLSQKIKLQVDPDGFVLHVWLIGQ